MPQEEAMQKYLMIVSELYPSWASGSSKVSSSQISILLSIVAEVTSSYIGIFFLLMNLTSLQKMNDEDTLPSSSAAKGPMGPVFSTFVHEEESDTDM